MKKKLFAVGLVGILAGCGGGVLEGQVPVYETGVLFIEPTVLSITSDVLSRYFKEELVKTMDANGQCTVDIPAQVCTGVSFSDDVVKFNFLLKNTAGFIASPVRITGYRITYDNCVSGEVYMPFGFVVNSNEQKQIDIVVVPSKVKEKMVQNEQIIYKFNGCNTIFTRPAYNTTCYANAIIEFDTVEIYTGINRKVKSKVKVKFEDTPGQGECVE